METIARGGQHFRVADPSWADPLDGSYSMQHGQRWNGAGSYPTTYLNADRAVARANARRLLTEQLRGQPFSAEDLDPAELPVLVLTEVIQAAYLDVVTARGVTSNGLPVTYPLDSAGTTVAHAVCQVIGSQAHSAGLPGVASRSAATHAPAGGEELAVFGQGAAGGLTVTSTELFDEWYGPFDW
jgi:RES domain-containing protein